MSEQYGLFAAPKIKLARARQHIEALKVQLETFECTNPFNIYIDLRPPRNRSWHIGMVAFIPPEVSLAYGDAVHCMRAALDLLAGDVVRHNKRSANHVYFPFSFDRDGLKKQITDKNFDRASSEAIRLLKELEPFWNGNDQLRGLHALDVADKHELILPTFPMIRVDHMKLHFSDGAVGEVINRVIPVGFDFPLHEVPERISFPGKITMKTYFSTETAKPFHLKPLLETIYSLADMVERIIERFELLLDGHINEPPSLEAVFQRPMQAGRMPSVYVRHVESDEQIYLWDFIARATA